MAALCSALHILCNICMFLFGVGGGGKPRTEGCTGSQELIRRLCSCFILRVFLVSCFVFYLDRVLHPVQRAGTRNCDNRNSLSTWCLV